eukprot:1442022-Alexandrium_andersonii.AAC.1
MLTEAESSWAGAATDSLSTGGAEGAHQPSPDLRDLARAARGAEAFRLGQDEEGEAGGAYGP